MDLKLVRQHAISIYKQYAVGSCIDICKVIPSIISVKCNLNLFHLIGIQFPVK